MVIQPLPCTACSNAWPSFWWRDFSYIQSKPTLVQLAATSSCPIACYLGKETDSPIAPTSSQVVVCCWLMLSCFQRALPGLFPPGIFQPLFPKPGAAGGCCDPSVGSATLPCWTSSSWPRTSNPACPDPSCPPAHQHCQLGVTWGCPWSPHPDHWYRYWTQLVPLPSPGAPLLTAPAAYNSIPHNSLGPAIHPGFFFPENSVFSQAMSSQFLQEKSVGNTDTGFTKFQGDTSTAFPLMP